MNLLGQSNPAVISGCPINPRKVLFGIAPGGACRATCCQIPGGLLPHRFTLPCMDRFHWRFGGPGGLPAKPAQALPGTVASGSPLSSPGASHPDHPGA